MRIALVSQEQLEPLVLLFKELNAFYFPESPAPERDIREHVAQNLLSPASPHQLVVATSSAGQAVGLAAITLMHSMVEPEPERRRQLHLKELFVSSRYRGNGCGRALMEWVAQYAVSNGCYRIDWPVQAANTKGISFYQRLGAVRVAERLSYRLSGSALAQLAASGNGAVGA